MTLCFHCSWPKCYVSYMFDENYKTFVFHIEVMNSIIAHCHHDSSDRTTTVYFDDVNCAWFLHL